ncbi:hypothetical protein AB0K43_04355 [Kitasatospora sp. NPDC049258]|uniref:hypothetical protein n=1 Tax=Kitasatospora sp. NPDC049258 TaxID=3155394 RepID=UPI00343EF4D7
MAICTSCGANSAGGARRCAACDRPFGAPAAVISEVVEVGGSGAYAGLGAAPEFTAPPAPAGRPPLGRWGRGVPYDPSAGRSALWGALFGRDWLPALRALAPATAVLVLLPLLLAMPADGIGGGFPFDDRFGAALALTTAAFGGPLHAVSDGLARYTFETDLRLLPMTVLALWLVALGLGLGPAVRRGRARAGGGATARQALTAAARVAALAGLVALLLGLLAGTTTGEAPPAHPGALGGEAHADVGRYGLALDSREAFGVDLGRSVAGTVLLAFLLAFLVHGADAIGAAARRRPALTGWLLAARVGGRVLAGSVGVSSLVAAVLVAVGHTGPFEPVWLLLVPNAGLVLLGFGSGAAVAGLTASTGERTEQFRASLFDLQGQSGQWRWALLLAVASACLLGWSAYRRRLGVADRLRLAVVHAVLLTVPMVVAGMSADLVVRRSRGASVGAVFEQGLDLGGSTHTTFGLVPAGVVVANLLWAALGALALPPLLRAVRGEPVGPSPVGPLPVGPSPVPVPVPARPVVPPAVAPPAVAPAGEPTVAPARPLRPPVPPAQAPAPAPPATGTADPHEAFRRPAGS